MIAGQLHRRPGAVPATGSAWSEGPVTLSAPDEPGPAIDTAGPLVADDAVIVADAVLYNRAALRESLGDSHDGGDAALIVRAYRRWGLDCPRHLLGDFSFAIWDRQRRRLFCARDHFGVKPFHYRLHDAGLSFAGQIGPLLDATCSADLSDAAVADFLAGVQTDAVSTLYRSIRRLPPAHRLIADEDGVAIDAYWTLAIGEPPAPASAADQFRALFEEAVRCRLDGVARPGMLLSGGLDSSSIACVARASRDRAGAPLPTFSLVFDRTPDHSETPFIRAVLDGGGLASTLIDGEDHAPFDGFAAQLGDQGGPFAAPNLSSIARTHRAARDAGVTVLLDGHGGDEVVSSGSERLDELAGAGAWLRLWRETGAFASGIGSARTGLYLRHVRHSGRTGRVGDRCVSALLRLSQRGTATHRPRPASFVHPDLAARTDLRDRLRAQRASAGGPDAARQAHVAVLTHPGQAYALEVLDRAMRAAGLAARYPFFDRRLVEFCVSLPARHKLDGGWPRLILRRAMEGVLPPAVQWRRDKLDFSPHLVAGLKHHRPLIASVLRDHELGRYANLAAARTVLGRLVESPGAVGGGDLYGLWRTVALGLWLRARRNAAAQAPAHASRAA